ncbi:MAG: GtrA family protein [Prevotella sp.]|nr:GtrA family protein [Bacteroidales bacterium]MDY4927192.1 GtrA family protein [Prevotella sp.]MDY5034403.1 GtrA family protein [Prevotella sp.]
MNRHGALEFGKAQISSMISTFADFVMTAAIFSIAAHVVFSTAAGAVTGGVVNCIINYRWTFNGTTRSKRSVAMRYALVWIGSVILNTAGTEWGVKAVNAICCCYAGHTQTRLALVLAVKAVTAILVAVFWNFLMQKHYVYRRAVTRD